MATSSTLSAGSGSQDPSFGGSGWTSAGNVVSSNNSYASATITSAALQIVDKNVWLRIGVDGFGNSQYAPTNLGVGVAYATSDTYSTYGDSAQMWGLDNTTLTPAIINDTAFGLAISCQTSDATPLYSAELYGYNFGFNIPTKANIKGVSGRVEKKAVWSSRSGVWTITVDHIELTVYYTIFIPKINIRFFSLALLGLCALSTGGIQEMSCVDNGILLTVSQTRSI